MSGPGYIVACSDEEVRQGYEVILLGRLVSGTPAVNHEASDVAWIARDIVAAFDIHPAQWRQIRDYLNQS